MRRRPPRRRERPRPDWTVLARLAAALADLARTILATLE
ncbi:hypothetical protein HD597_012866 [Nonomuraea thailandensis]|uniref:Uncharacterized protein n=1 Tax=Nonomuraea thailandensis TaxID=1188745 RepID=A0A9X2GXZ9_9ACTN|nr:hypothetical protein [Nonomuraea thailandensis]